MEARRDLVASPLDGEVTGRGGKGKRRRVRFVHMPYLALQTQKNDHKRPLAFRRRLSLSDFPYLIMNIVYGAEAVPATIFKRGRLRQEPHYVPIFVYENR